MTIRRELNIRLIALSWRYIHKESERVACKIQSKKKLLSHDDAAAKALSSANDLEDIIQSHKGLASIIKAPNVIR